MSEFIINHVIQPTDNTCVSACMAMILDKDVNEIIKEFHDSYWGNCIVNNEFDYLDKYGIKYDLCNARDQAIYEGSINYVFVPSLNTIGGSHAIIVDTRNGIKVYDPCDGVYKSYTFDKSELSDTKIWLSSWFLVCRFDVETLKNSCN